MDRTSPAETVSKSAQAVEATVAVGADGYDSGTSDNDHSDNDDAATAAAEAADTAEAADNDKDSDDEAALADTAEARSDMNTRRRCSRDWSKYFRGFRATPPDFRKYASGCADVHTKWINKLKGNTRGGKLYIALRHVQKYFFKRNNFKTSDCTTVTAARRALIEFAKNAKSIIPTQDALKEEANAKRKRLLEERAPSLNKDGSGSRKRKVGSDGMDALHELAAVITSGRGSGSNIHQTEIDLNVTRRQREEAQRQKEEALIQQIKLQTHMDALKAAGIAIKEEHKAKMYRSFADFLDEI